LPNKQTKAANGGFSRERARKETMRSPVYNTRYPATPSPRGRLIWRVTVLSPRKRPWKVNETLVDEKAWRAWTVYDAPVNSASKSEALSPRISREREKREKGARANFFVDRFRNSNGERRRKRIS